MRTLGPRWRGAMVGLLVIACGHAPPPRAPEPDDDRAGATELVGELGSKTLAAEGVLDAHAGDLRDWYRLRLPTDGPRLFDVIVDGDERDGHLPLFLDVYDAAGRLIKRLEPRPFAGIITIWGTDLDGRGDVFLAVQSRPSSPRTAYYLKVQNIVAPPPPEPPRCDPHNWDARNPRCADVCNFKAPDLHTPQCCDIMRPCSNGIAVGKCVGKIIAFSDGYFTVKVGRADAGVDFLSARLVAPIGEPQVFSPSGRDITALDHQHWLSFVSADEHSSVWRLGTEHGHDVAWLGANATQIEIIPPPICRGGDYVPRRP